MARYLFDIDDNGTCLPAEQFLDFADAGAARADAVRALSSIMAETPLPPTGRRYVAITVRDRAGAAIFRVSLTYNSDVMGLRRARRP